MVKGKLDHKEVTLLNILYMPLLEAIRVFLRKIFDLITCETFGVLICVGDLNN